MTATLTRYRLRPVPWGRLAGLAAGWFLATRALVGIPDDPTIGVKVFRWAAFLLGLGGTVLAAARTSVLGGGATAMAAVIALSSAGRAWPAWFPVQLDSGPGDPRWQSSQAWMAGLSLALLAVAMLAERRTDAPLRLPHRRATAQPDPPSKAQARP